MPASMRSLSYYIAIGLIQGLALYLATSDYFLLPGLPYGLCAAVLVAGAELQLLGATVRQRGTVWLVLGLALLIGGQVYWLYSDGLSAWVLQTGVFCAGVLSYIGIAFILAWPTRAGGWPRYQDLFRHAWNNVFIVLLALLLTGLFLSLLALSMKLFTMLGIARVEALLSSHTVISLSLPVVFSLGMRMGRQNEKVIGLLRGILLTLCRFLLPLGALITVLFTLALPFTGVQAIWATGQSTTILLTLVGINLFLVNGVFQDGQAGSAYPRLLRRLVEACLLCMPVLAGLAAWSSWLRVEQYGLTPSRIFALLLVAVMLVHGLAAAWAVLGRSATWLGSLRYSNPWVAVLSAVLLVLYFSPVIDPLGRSTDSQVERLLSGRTPPADFDAQALYGSLGTPGIVAFTQLEQRLKRDELFDPATRKQLLAAMAMAKPGWLEERAPTFEWLGPQQPGVETITGASDNLYLCDDGCYLWAVDLGGDGRDEVLVIPRGTYNARLNVYTQDGAGWRKVGSLHTRAQNFDEMLEQIRQGTVKAVTPRYKTLSFAGQELRQEFEQ
ncbi:DUF4153 domain-containing protein [Pseudomonas sp. NPDC089406]|uniref:DUF4153 domain-containing protein n=1 Tax=Pseudomonas sp. NPDC089406 TaxID=3364463 RepID=UPI00384C4B76